MNPYNYGQLEQAVSSRGRLKTLHVHGAACNILRRRKYTLHVGRECDWRYSVVWHKPLS